MRKKKATVEAPYVEPDIRMLGDRHLDPKENVHKQREELLTMASRHKIGGQAELEDPQRALGPRLPYNEIISRLRRCNSDLKFLDGSPGNIAVYARRNKDQFNEEWKTWSQTFPPERPADEFFLHFKYVTGFPMHDIPEYSTVEIDTSHLPTRENRGWRSILITLLKAGSISYHAAVREFGDCDNDQRGWRWREQTLEWRQHPYAQFIRTKEYRNE